MKQPIPEEKILAFLKEIEAGSIKLSSQEGTENFYSGNLRYLATNGWTITVFIDAGEWDYIDNIILDDQRVIDFEALDEIERIRNYCPSEKAILSHYKLTGESS